MDYNELMGLCEELDEYAKLEGTEIGETCEALIQLTSFLDYVSVKFRKSLEVEISRQLKNFKDNSKIIEREVNMKVFKVRELEWNN